MHPRHQKQYHYASEHGLQPAQQQAQGCGEVREYRARGGDGGFFDAEVSEEENRSEEGEGFLKGVKGSRGAAESAAALVAGGGSAKSSWAGVAVAVAERSNELPTRAYQL